MKYSVLDGEYAFGYEGTDETSTQRFIFHPNKIHFASIGLGETIEVKTLSNPDIQDLTRTKYNNLTRTTLVGGTQAFADFTTLQNGTIRLRQNARDSEDVWVF